MRYTHLEIEKFSSDMSKCVEKIHKKLDKLEERLKNLSTQGGAIEGETANAIDDFIYNVPYVIIGMLEHSVLPNYTHSFRTTLQEFLSYVDEAPFIIDDGFLDILAWNIKQRGIEFKDLHASFFDICSAYNNSGVGAFITVPSEIPTITTFVKSEEALKETIQKLQEFNAKHLNDLEEINLQLNYIKRMCTIATEGKMPQRGIQALAVPTQLNTAYFGDTISELERFGATHLPSENIRAEAENIYNRMIWRDNNGNVIINWLYVEDLLHNTKDLTEAELWALTVLMLNVPSANGQSADENLQTFISIGYEEYIEVEMVQLDKQITQITRSQSITAVFYLLLLNTEKTTMPIARNTIWADSPEVEGYDAESDNESIKRLTEKLMLAQIILNYGAAFTYAEPDVIERYINENVSVNRNWPIVLNRNENGNMAYMIPTGFSQSDGYYYYGGISPLGNNGVLPQNVIHARNAAEDHFGNTMGYNYSTRERIARLVMEDFSKWAKDLVLYDIPVVKKAEKWAKMVDAYMGNELANQPIYDYLDESANYRALDSLGVKVVFSMPNGEVFIHMYNTDTIECQTNVNGFIYNHYEEYGNLTQEQVVQVVMGEYTGSDIPVAVQEELRVDYANYYEFEITEDNEYESDHQPFLSILDDYAQNVFSMETFESLTREQRQETIDAVMAQQES